MVTKGSSHRQGAATLCSPIHGCDRSLMTLERPWWVAIVASFVVGCSLGRAGVSSGEARLILDAADTFDEAAAVVDIAAEAQQAEQEVYSLWVDTMQSEIDGLRELKAEYPNTARFDEAITAATAARRQASVSAELVNKYWDANKVEAGRLRSLAARLREYAD